MQTQISQVISDAPKTVLAVGGMSTPAIANNPQVIDYNFLTTYAVLNVTVDVWIMMASFVYVLHSLGLFRGVKWVYLKMRSAISG